MTSLGTSWPYEPSLSVACRRGYSSVLAAFPWHWEGFVSKPQGLNEFADKIPEFKHFIESLDRYESRLFKVGASRAVSDVLAVLGLEIDCPPSNTGRPPTFLAKHREQLTSQDFHSLASIIGAYAFFEVLVLRANLIVCKPAPSLPVMYLPPSKTKMQAELHGWNEVINWLNVLFNFRKIMGKLAGRDQMVTMKSDDSLTALLRMVNSSNTNNDYHKIENNVLYAALHINTMKSIVLGDDQIPDMPKDILKRKYDLHIDRETALAAGSDGQQQQQDTPVVEELRRANNPSPAMMRNALHVSEILTPLFLLLPKQLVKLSFHRRTVLEMAVKIRPHKSELMLRVEGIIWDAVFALSRGDVTPLEVLQKLVEALPWEELEAALAQEHAYSLVASSSGDPTLTTPPRHTTPVGTQTSTAYSTNICIDAFKVATPLNAGTTLCGQVTDEDATFREEIVNPLEALSTPVSDFNIEVGLSEMSGNVVGTSGLLTSGAEPSVCDALGNSNAYFDKPHHVQDVRSLSSFINPTVENNVQAPFGSGEPLDESVVLNDGTMPPMAVTVSNNAQQSVELQTFDKAKRPAPLDQSELAAGGLAMLTANGGVSNEPRMHVCPGIVEIINGKIKRWTRNRTASVEDVEDEDDVDLSRESSRPPPLGPVDGLDFLDGAERGSVEDAGGGSPATGSVNRRARHHAFDKRIFVHPARVVNGTTERSSTGPSARADGGSKGDDHGDELESELSEVPLSEESDGEQPEVEQPNLSTGLKRKKRKARLAKEITQSSKSPGQVSVADVSKRSSGRNTSVNSGLSSVAKPAKNAKPAVSTRGTKRLRLSEGDTASDPIDVDAFHSIFEPSVVREFVWPKTINLKGSKPRRRVQSDDTFVAWDSTGAEKSFVPEAHHDIFLHNFKTFMDRAKTDYVEGLPKFISEPEKSCLLIIEYASFMAMDASEQQNMLAGKSAAIIRNWPVDGSLKFDSKGLRTLTACFTAPLDLLGKPSLRDLLKQRTDFDIDYSHKGAEIGEPVLMTGQAIDLLENLKQDGKILNGLDFPKWNGNLDSNALTTDIAAWEHTRGLYFSDDRGASYPGSDMNWSLAALQWAITNIHVDADGAFTKNLVACGKKGWGFIKDTRTLKLSSIDFFHDPGFDLHKVLPDSQYDVEFIILNPGDMLLMKPNTPHFVITLEPSICYGGHLFPTVTMQQTLAGLIHTFVGDRYLSNAAHHPSRLLLRRILLFYHMGILDGNIPEDDVNAQHLPNHRDIDGLLNLLCVCVLVIMGNVLDFRTYSAPNQYDDTKANKHLGDLMDRIDLNKIPENERKAICYARGVACHIMDWVRACCVVTKSNGEIVRDFPSRFFVQIARSTLNYKKRASQLRLDGAPHCTFERVEHQLANLIAFEPKLQAMWDKGKDIPFNSFELEDKADYSVKWMVGWERQWRGRDIDFLLNGLTAFDKAYFASYTEWCRFQNEILPKLGSTPAFPPAKKIRIS